MEVSEADGSDDDADDNEVHGREDARENLDRHFSNFLKSRESYGLDASDYSPLNAGGANGLRKQGKAWRLSNEEVRPLHSLSKGVPKSLEWKARPS